MAHEYLIDAFTSQPAFAALRDALPRPGATQRIGPLPGSSPALLLAALQRAQPTRVLVGLAASPSHAETLHADLVAVLGEGTSALFPQRETLPYETGEADLEVKGLRIEALEAWLAGRARILVTTPRALQEMAEIPEQLADLRLRLERGQSTGPAELAARLEEMGFERVTTVDGVGQFALRGGILDLFGFGAPDPVRVEFWGDEIESLRHFDVLDQRSNRTVEAVDVLPVELPGAETGGGETLRALLEVLNEDALVLEVEAGSVADEFERTWKQVLQLREAEERRGAGPAPPERLFLPPEQAARALERLPRLIAADPAEADVRLDLHEPEEVDRDMEALGSLLRASAQRGELTWILCDNLGQLERLEEILDAQDARSEAVRLAVGAVDGGFVIEGTRPPVRILTDHEIFRRAHRGRRGRRFRGAVSLENLAQLSPGDYVVHLDHGIGRFRGLDRIKVGEETVESLAIEYAGGEVLRVPVYRLDLVERWMSDRGDDVAPPKLHRVGGKTWKKLRGRTEKAIEEMTAELLELYARRKLAVGHAYPQDGRWQREMEAAFVHEDTPDQRKATDAIKKDLESTLPMDRLLCGDVGFGKTEVAIRAAFKVVQDGRQVAVLAPTTILAEQHGRTFRERLADFPVRIEVLSRFRTPSEQTAIIEGLATGEVDIVVGTHRLLQDDVTVKELGLLVIDEEQRFGVSHKERLRKMRENVDVLSMTATPIPRTMHLAMAGLRDLSLIQTPPRNRMPVVTHVIRWTDAVIQDALLRELDRGGQVYVVHDRVETIDPIAERIRRLAGEAHVEVAHGQMGAHDLERVMTGFVDGEVDVLVSTSIIENGLDVPNANTLIVHRAENFGLAQLYQIRGRVGRSHHRAYCYLIVPEDVTEDAEKRLRILEHYTELGSGYAVALKDLELRGAGNLLGAEQSGFVHAVGLETYTRLLEKTVQRIKAQQDGVKSWPPPEVSMRGAAFLPDHYITDSGQKLQLYRRVSRIGTTEELDELRAEVRDRFGPPPSEVENLFAATALRLLGAQLGVERVLIAQRDARLNFREDVVPRMTALQSAMRDRQLQVEVKRAIPLSLILRAHGAEPIAETLVAALRLLSDGR